jgi:hypothetical protein
VASGRSGGHNFREVVASSGSGGHECWEVEPINGRGPGALRCAQIKEKVTRLDLLDDQLVLDRRGVTNTAGPSRCPSTPRRATRNRHHVTGTHVTGTHVTGTTSKQRPHTWSTTTTDRHRPTSQLLVAGTRDPPEFHDGLINDRGSKVSSQRQLATTIVDQAHPDRPAPATTLDKTTHRSRRRRPDLIFTGRPHPERAAPVAERDQPPASDRGGRRDRRRQVCEFRRQDRRLSRNDHSRSTPASRTGLTQGNSRRGAWGGPIRRSRIGPALA